MTEEQGLKVIKLNPLAIGDRFVRQEIELQGDEAKLVTYNDLEEVMDQHFIDPDLVTDQCKSCFGHEKEQIKIKTLND